jgi:hypothetical protein
MLGELPVLMVLLGVSLRWQVEGKVYENIM